MHIPSTLNSPYIIRNLHRLHVRSHPPTNLISHTICWNVYDVSRCLCCSPGNTPTVPHYLRCDNLKPITMGILSQACRYFLFYKRKVAIYETSVFRRSDTPHHFRLGVQKLRACTVLWRRDVHTIGNEGRWVVLRGREPDYVTALIGLLEHKTRDYSSDTTTTHVASKSPQPMSDNQLYLF
jgi:hypothetical protein